MKYTWLILPIGILAFFVGRYVYHIPEFKVGGKVPNIEAMMESGEKMDLYQFADDKLVLVEFWGSWCGPCRQSNKGLVKVYEEFGGEGFEILSIALERKDDVAVWQSAVLKDGLTWKNHIRQLWGDSELRNLYEITEVPSNYLVDKGGRIVGVNMTETELEKYLKDKLVK